MKSSIKNILIIDDDPCFLHFCEKTLKGLGHKIHTVKSGEDGLSKISQLRNSSDGEIDFIIVDQNMEGMSGINFISYYRQLGCKQVPIVMISGEDKSEIEAKLKNVGGLGLIKKPIVKKVKLMRLVDTLI